MREGGRRLALDTMLDLSDVVLMTLVGGCRLACGCGHVGACSKLHPAPLPCTQHTRARAHTRTHPPMHALSPVSSQEEATQVTGCSEAEQAARFILQRPGAKTQWCVIKMGGAGALLMTRTGNGTFKSEALPVSASEQGGGWHAWGERGEAPALQRQWRALGPAAGCGGKICFHMRPLFLDSCTVTASTPPPPTHAFLHSTIALTPPCTQVEVSDTVGCGDSFAAAIVLGYIRGHSIHSTLLLANAVGAATAMGRGAGRNVASAQQVQQLLRSAEGGGRHPEGHVQGALTILEVGLVPG